MTIGIKYISDGRISGYGLAGLAYIKALHAAGIPVWPFFTGPKTPPGDLKEASFLPLARAAQGDASLSDMPALMRATARPIPYDTVVLHTLPELWQRFAERDKRLIGYTVWEAEALPGSWPPILDTADAILVPSRFSADRLFANGVARPVRVVPHVRRSVWSETAREDGAALRRQMAIPADHFVFYTIGVWNPRKAIGELIDAFARAFAADNPVTLLVKTSAMIELATEGWAAETDIHGLIAAIVSKAGRDAGRPAARVACIAADNLTGRTLESIHAAGDAYVSLSHGEGWGLGAFDAATLGKPVIMTGWGGQLDFLGADYPGLVRYELVPVTGWQPVPGYRAAQRWASADAGHAIELMRAAAAHDTRLQDAASARRELIARRFAADIVAKQFLAAIEG